MNVVVEKAQSFLGLKKKVDVATKEELERKLESAEIRVQIRTQAVKVANLKEKYGIHNRLDPEYFNPTQMEVIHVELDAAERVFFTLFNRLRALYNLKPLEGVKFTGEYNYKAHTEE